MDPTLAVEGKKLSGQNMSTGCPQPPHYYPFLREEKLNIFESRKTDVSITEMRPNEWIFKTKREGPDYMYT